MRYIAEFSQFPPEFFHRPQLQFANPTMPRHELTEEQILDEGEKLFLELAKSY